MSLLPATAIAARDELDAAAASRPSPAQVARLQQLRNDPALVSIGSPAHVDERFGVPSFVWATRPSTTARARGPLTREQAARDHLGRLRPYYNLDGDDVRDATIRQVHDNGRGPIIVTFQSSVDGVEVFRDRLKVLMDRNLDLVAVAGYIPGRAEAGRPEDRVFGSTAAVAIARALQDFDGTVADPGSIRRTRSAPGSYEWHELGTPGQTPAGVESVQPIRSKPVLFHLPGRLVPAYYVELIDGNEAAAYVVSAADGSLLFRHDLVADDLFTYRVWADGTPQHIPFDGPQGSAATPHPTGLPDNFSPSFVASGPITLQNGPISTNDPWLAPGATQTIGNNVDAYADLFPSDGFTAGQDFRAATTSPSTFDHTYDTSQPADLSATQRMASITQLFYTTNFLHDWFYDAGFDEASGNAQKLNFGRGGLENDDMRAEAQDYLGINNANMTTPADGARPRMQMYVFHMFTIVRVNSPPAIAGDRQAASAKFGPQTFQVTADVVVVNDGSGTTTDGCQPIVNPVAGKIALIDRTGSDCAFTVKVLNAQAAGAVGVLVADHGPGLVTMTGTGAISIPSLMITKSDGDAIKAALGGGPVSVTLFRSLSRDGTIDNQIVAHEWGHYLSRRLIGDGAGLSNRQGRGMGEGWGDFNAMLLCVRPEDATAPSGPNFTGVYGMGGYALHNSLFGTNAYYFGVRRYPYSTEFNRNPLTFQHIENGVPLPVGPPVAYGADGADNSQVHNTGEVWCTMLWECYAALLRRLPFAQAQDRMREYLVASLKLTPNDPTLVEARDAVLSAAYASDPADFNDFCAAFARRGCGVGAVAPDRYSNTNEGVIESYICGGDLQVQSVSLDDDVHSCDSDGYLDEGEIATFTVTLRNAGSTDLSATTATLTSTNPAITFPSGPNLVFPPTQVFGTTTASAYVRSAGAAGLQSQDIRIHYNDPGLAVAGPRIHDFGAMGNADDVLSVNETVEAAVPNWGFVSAVLYPSAAPWERQEISTLSHRFYGPDPGGFSDETVVSPPLLVGGGNFSFTFKHSYSFEASGGTNWDGGVVEISDNDGFSWTDIGVAILPGYGGTLSNQAGNPIGGRPAFVGSSPAFPSYTIATASLGTAYAGKTVLIRFRVGADAATGGAGWLIDDLQFTGLLNQPFLDVVADPGPCASTTVENLPATLEFAVAGANPAAGPPAFRFGLPHAAHVEVTIHDVSGRRVATVVAGALPAGRHTAAWDARGGPPPGVYFARLVADGKRMTRRLVVLSR